MKRQTELFEMPWVPTVNKPVPEEIAEDGWWVTRKLVREFWERGCEHGPELEQGKGKMWVHFWDWALHASGAEIPLYSKRARRAFDSFFSVLEGVGERERSWTGIRAKPL